MLQCFTARHVARLAYYCLGVMMLFTAIADAQSALSLTGQLRSAYPQSTFAEPIAAVARSCSSISSLSRRCHFTFDKDCKKRGESKDHCTRMSGFCHGCTDAYATCKGAQNSASRQAGASGTDCTRCNVAYGQCISRMVQQYGGRLEKVK